jgi:predicted 3-demethylubiquinone-9 3-methyltransferase (glyoxalase superfamily)
MNRVIPNFWFDGQAEQVAKFYTSLFKNSKVGHIAYYADAGKEIHGHNAGDVLTVEFQLENMRFIALNGGPQFKVNPSISFLVRCETGEEVDDLWQKLSNEGEILMPLDLYPFSRRYGWLKDKFGISWQIALNEQKFVQKITPALMFTQSHVGQAEDAMNFYTSVFPNSRIGTIMRYTAGQEPDTEDNIMYGEFTLLGDDLAATDSARDHDFSFNEAISLMIECDTQEEIDIYWEKLSAVPKAEVCGWLKDKYGISWQIVPTSLGKMMTEGTPKQVEEVTTAFMKMGKLDTSKLEKIYKEAS